MISEKFQFGLVLFLVVFLSCKSENVGYDEALGTPLVSIGSKTISIEEFIKRAEYTIRPPYCRDNLNIHKNIVLNSLIAEKLLAMDTDKTIDDPRQLSYLKGRKEQKMRELLFIEKAYNLVSIDTSEVHKIAGTALRTYQVKYITLSDPVQTNELYQKLLNGMSFEELTKTILHLDHVSTREVTYLEEKDPYISLALFGSQAEKDHILEPIRTSEGIFIIMQVSGWTSQVSLSPVKQSEFLDQISEKLKTDKAMILFNQFVSDVMRGKEMKLIPDTFKELVEVVREHYIASRAEKEELVQLTLWKDENRTAQHDEKPSQTYDANMPIADLNGQIWSLKDIERLVEVHPLVFRKKRIQPDEFPEQLKFALADLFRDYFLTQEAYHLGFDSHQSVRQEIEMWSDSYLANRARDQILSAQNAGSTEGVDVIKTIETYLNPRIKELFHKYSHDIRINLKEYDALKLTSVDMFAIMEDAPYPVIVPDFPLLTTIHQLDYGQNMELK